MISNLGKLELRCLDQMTRQELIEAIGRHGDYLNIDLREGLEQHSTDYLRWLLLATRLLHTLRILQRCTGTETASPATNRWPPDPSLS
jgi:hypothetical protein